MKQDTPGASPLSNAQEVRMQRLEAFADLMDARFFIPGTNWRFGLDGLVGLIPGIGDAATSAIALWILWEGYQLGASKATLAQMAGNIAVDFAVGTIPVAGDIFDVAFKSNRRNVTLLRRHLTRRQRRG